MSAVCSLHYTPPFSLSLSFFFFFFFFSFFSLLSRLIESTLLWTTKSLGITPATCRLEDDEAVIHVSPSSFLSSRKTHSIKEAVFTTTKNIVICQDIVVLKPWKYWLGFLFAICCIGCTNLQQVHRITAQKTWVVHGQHASVKSWNHPYDTRVWQFCTAAWKKSKASNLLQMCITHVVRLKRQRCMSHMEELTDASEAHAGSQQYFSHKKSSPELGCCISPTAPSPKWTCTWLLMSQLTYFVKAGHHRHRHDTLRKSRSECSCSIHSGSQHSFLLHSSQITRKATFSSPISMATRHIADSSPSHVFLQVHHSTKKGTTARTEPT